MVTRNRPLRISRIIPHSNWVEINYERCHSLESINFCTSYTLQISMPTNSVSHSVWKALSGRTQDCPSFGSNKGV